MELGIILAATSKRSKPEVLYLTSQLICEYLIRFYHYLDRLGAICSSLWVEEIRCICAQQVSHHTFEAIGQVFLADIVGDDETNMMDRYTRSDYDLVKSLPGIAYTNRWVLMHSSTDD